MPKTEAELIAEAVAAGYPDVDETCKECGMVLKNYHHFINCNSATCPMADGNGTILQQWMKLKGISEAG